MSEWTKVKANRLQEFAHEREIVGDMDSARLMWAALSEITRLRAAVEKLVMHFGSCIDHGSRCVLPHKWHVEHCDDGNVCTQCVRDWLESELEGGGGDE
jgi:hypothetical protein